jgi:hypothetical protein
MRSQICAPRQCAIRFAFGTSMLVAALLLAPTVVMAETPSQEATSSIIVEGNRRIEAQTIRSYFHVRPGGQLDDATADAALKDLLATGLFQDVRISHARDRLVVTVVENPVINRVAFEGNKSVKDDQLRGELQSKAAGPLSRGRWCRPTLSVSPISIVAAAASTCALSPRSSSCRTSASISYSSSGGGEPGIKKIVLRRQQKPIRRSGSAGDQVGRADYRSFL